MPNDHVNRAYKTNTNEDEQRNAPHNGDGPGHFLGPFSRQTRATILAWQNIKAGVAGTLQRHGCLKKQATSTGQTLVTFIKRKDRHFIALNMHRGQSERFLCYKHSTRGTVLVAGVEADPSEQSKHVLCLQCYPHRGQRPERHLQFSCNLR